MDYRKQIEQTVNDREATQTIFEGDRVRIETQGIVRKGKVLTIWFDSHLRAYNIELDSDSHGYTYWKQGTDGGTVTKI